MESKIKLIADITVLLNDKVLLVRYKNSNKYDHQKGWFLPDDEINYGEHPNDGAARILKDQLNIHGTDLSLNHIESFTGNDRSWHLVFHYILRTNTLPEIEKSEEIEEVKWFHINEFPAEKEIAHHGWAKYTLDEILKSN